MNEDRTKIQVTRRLRDRLRAMKRGGDTYNDVILRLVSINEESGTTQPDKGSDTLQQQSPQSGDEEMTTEGR